MLSVALPSRGLVFSKTMQAVVDGMQAVNKLGIATQLVMSHDLPIPDCHNFIIEQSLQNQAVTKILMTEEDNFIPVDAFVALATSDNAISILQYNDKNGSPNGILHYNEAGEVLWGGVGAVCIKREVFEAVERPFFRTDVRYKVIKQHKEGERFITDYEELPIRSQYQYGGQDVDFYTRVRKLGYKVTQLEQFRAHHFELLKHNEFDENGTRTNHGVHTIRTV